jgi:lysosome membrane protein 2/scavenger receptor class B protein 1
VRFYFMNLTNVDTVRKGGKPILQEVGPYTYTKHSQKLNVSFSADNASVAFNEFFYHLPAPELSCDGSPALDAITTLNLPLIGAVEAIRGHFGARWAPWVQLLARLVEGWGDKRVKGLFTTRTVDEWLWGFEDPLLSRASRLLPHARFPTRFALARNMSTPADSGPADRDAAATGAGEPAQTWHYRSWHGVERVSSWAAPHLEEVRGTDASQFAPGLGPGDSLEVWVGEAFRAARLVQGVGRGGRGARVGGVPVLRFRPDPAQRAPDPRYFQTVAGLMNVTAPTAAGPGGQAGAAAGPSLFLSLPGYCGADPELAAGVEGVACDEDRHDIFVDVGAPCRAACRRALAWCCVVRVGVHTRASPPIADGAAAAGVVLECAEPTTGTTLRAVKSLMLSSWFGERYGAVDPGVQDTYLPVFWAQEASQAGAEQLARFAPLLRALRARRALQSGARPAALAASLAGLACLVAAVALPARRGVWHEEEAREAGTEAEAAPLVGGGGRPGDGAEEGLGAEASAAGSDDAAARV